MPRARNCFAFWLIFLYNIIVFIIGIIMSQLIIEVRISDGCDRYFLFRLLRSSKTYGASLNASNGVKVLGELAERRLSEVLRSEGSPVATGQRD